MEFRILGPLEVWDDDRAIPLPAGKARSLLAILLLHANQIVSTDRLIDELWGERPPGTAATGLHGRISQLRKALGKDAVITRPPGYLLPLEPNRLDLDRFSVLLERGRAHTETNPEAAAATMREALSLWRGPALADFSFEPFAQAEIVRIEELRLAALEDRVDADLAVGRHNDLTGELEALIRRYPLRERLWCQLMLALYRSGRQAEALEAYQDARRELVDQLGIDPGPDLQRLEKAILLQDESLNLIAPDRPPEPRAAQPMPAPVPAATVDPAPPVRELRKTVTILFTDIVRSTQLSEQLDPEALRRLMSRYFECVSGVLARHGGTTEKFIGDAVMAVFGIPTVHEDDALRTVRAVTDMRDELELLNVEFDEVWGVRIRTRTGVNTGEVVSGGDGDMVRGLVTGDPVNLAARLEQAAEPDEALIGEATWRLVRNAVRVEEVPDLGLKGRSGAERAFRLLDVLPDTPGFSRRLDAPLVGRELELAQLRHAFARTSQERRPYLFTLLGPAGIGKSRLVGEFIAGLDDQTSTLVGRCLPYGEGITFWPLAEIVDQTFGADLRAGILGLSTLDGDGELVAERIEAAVGRGAAVGKSEETFWAVRRLLEALAHERSTVLVFEDMHWAEPTLLDLVDYLADWTQDVPILIVCLARAEFLDDRPGWGGGKLNAASVLLQALSQEESAALVDSLLADTVLDTRTRSAIEEAAGGNPLFVEQMLAMLAENGGHGRELLVPPTIQALLAARLDRLGPGERMVAEAASVIGKEFWRSAVEDLLPHPARESARAHLLTLVHKELLRPNRSLFSGEEAFRFSHILIQDATYRGIAKEVRADLHERFGAWLERTAKDRISEYEEILGYHLEQSVQYRRQLGLAGEPERAIARRAGELLGAAGRRACNRDDMPTAANLLGRALALLPAESPNRGDLELMSVEALSAIGQLERAEEILHGTIARASAAGDTGLEMHARLEALLLRTMTDPGFDTATLLEATEDAIAVFEGLQDERGLAKAWRAVAEVHLTGCRWGQSAEALERALEHARLSGDQREVTLALTHLANSLYWGPTPVGDAVRRCEQILELGAGQLTVEANVLCYLGGLRAMEGDIEGGLDLIARGRGTFERLGHTRGLANQSVVAGPVMLLAGDPAGAEAELRAAQRLLATMGDTGILASVTAFLAEAIYAQGRYEEAVSLSHVSEEAATADDAAAQIGWRAVRAKALSRRGEPAEAERLASEAVALADDTDFLNLQADSLLALAEVRALTESPQEELLRRALALYGAKGNAAAAERASNLLSEGEALLPG